MQPYKPIKQDPCQNLTIEIMKIIALLFNGHKNLKIRNNTTNLLANLGMVEYIVTDKTGTLTENALDIALIAVNDQIYFNDYEVAESEESERNNSMSRLNPTRAPSHFLGEIHGFKELFNNFCMNPENDKFLKFFTCLAICNLAFPENDDFVAISVDDKILARTAANFGIRLMSRDSETCVISVHGKEILYQVLGTQAFSSDIKKSRIVVKNSLNNSVFMFIKGSRDSMIKVYDSLTYNRLDFEDAIIQYRTLFLGVKEMNKKEANEFVYNRVCGRYYKNNREHKKHSNVHDFSNLRDFGRSYKVVYSYFCFYSCIYHKSKNPFSVINFHASKQQMVNIQSASLWGNRQLKFPIKLLKRLIRQIYE